jgi:hypothetical protein
MFKKSTLISAIRVFNNLPTDIKSIADSTFKRTLKKWLIDKAYYNLKEFYANIL